MDLYEALNMLNEDNENEDENEFVKCLNQLIDDSISRLEFDGNDTFTIYVTTTGKYTMKNLKEEWVALLKYVAKVPVKNIKIVDNYNRGGKSKLSFKIPKEKQNEETIDNINSWLTQIRH